MVANLRAWINYEDMILELQLPSSSLRYEGLNDFEFEFQV